jgi:alpha-L-rhamnosidase
MRLLNYLKSSWKATVWIALLVAGSLSLSGQEAPVDAQARTEAESPFISAQPIWPKGLVDTKNITIAYRTLFQRPTGNQATLKITGHSLYRIFLNGQFLGHGPARGPHDYYRVDEWSLSGKMKKGENLLTVEVAGYNVNSFYLVDRPPFLQAELLNHRGEVIASTGGVAAQFEGVALTHRVQKVQRYSFQRPFSEVYKLTPDFNEWSTDPKSRLRPLENEVQSAKKYLPRRVPYTWFTKMYPTAIISAGTLEANIQPASFWRDRSLTGIGPQLGGFPESELARIPSLELQTVANKDSETLDITWDRENHHLELKGLEYRILDFGTNSSGFIGAKVEANKKTRLFFTFDEILRNNDVDFKRMSCVNIIEYELAPGTYFLESFEPYTFRYLKVMSLEGDCTVSQIYLREYANDAVWDADFRCNDERLNHIYEAARHTFRQNAIDIFMDCPSRERAGWLCDSFFTARVEYDLTGQSIIERAFLENYLLPEKFEHIPEGMVSMCYPADHYDGVFIPNWCMWMVSELEEYVQRTGDYQMADKMKPRVLGIINFLQKYKNSDGLLENLPSWVFVEWSRANSLVQDVNYPSNMHFASILEIAAKLYNMPELAAEGYVMRETIRKQSWNGKFFVDNAVRKDGKLVLSGESTEVCQYFAFYFDIVSPESHPELWSTLVSDFGPKRKETKTWPEIHMANQLIGNVMRLELLSRYGEGVDKILDESVDYLLYMAERTGTLWENDGDYASCNHGFASHQIRVFYRDVLGVKSLDRVRRIVRFDISDIPLEWCEGSLPTPDGIVKIRWERNKEGELKVNAKLPKGWVLINNTK